MQQIHSLDVILGVPNAVPSNGKHICTAFIGNSLRVYYVTDGEATEWTWVTFILINLSLETIVPDGFICMGPVAKQRWDSDNILLFARM